MITIHTHLSQADFIRASLLLAYRRLTYAVITLLALLMLVLNAVLESSAAIKDVPSYIPAFVLLFIPPLLVVLTAIRQYRTNAAYRRAGVYTFSADSLEIQSEGSLLRLEYSLLPKVARAGSLLLIYQSTSLANVVPLQHVSKEQLLQLKALLDAGKVKNNL